jgi:hypothetical protein
LTHAPRECGGDLPALPLPRLSEINRRPTEPFSMPFLRQPKAGAAGHAPPGNPVRDAV